MNEQENIEISLVNSIVSENLTEISIDSAELSLDYFLNDGILKDIPFFGTFYKSCKTFMGIKEALFSKKVYNFLMQLKDIPKEKKIAFVNKIEINSKEKIKVGQQLILIIEQLDDLNKPEIIGNLFCATIKDQISYEEFRRLSSMVQKAFLPDIIQLRKTYSIASETQEHLNSIGIIKVILVDDPSKRYSSQNIFRSSDNSSTAKQIIKYEINPWGKKLLKYGFENNIKE